MCVPVHKTHFDDDDLLFSEQFGDHYFSRHDGRAECQHVFIAGNGLPARWQGRETFHIGELGFGTGLNFLTTWQIWQQTRNPGQNLHFTSVEGYPLNIDVARRSLARWPELSAVSLQLLNHWHQLSSPIDLDGQTTLQVIPLHVDVALGHFPKIDAWYLDGFAPAKNPDMWSLPVMEALANVTVPGGTLASYTAAGWVRRNLEAVGFEVEKRRGFGTKRDMIAGHLA